MSTTETSHPLTSKTDRVGPRSVLRARGKLAGEVAVLAIRWRRAIIAPDGVVYAATRPQIFVPYDAGAGTNQGIRCESSPISMAAPTAAADLAGAILAIAARLEAQGLG